MISLSNLEFVNLGLTFTDNVESICIIGNTIGFFGALIDNRISMSDSNPKTINDNLAWIFNEVRKNSKFFIVGDNSTIRYYNAVFKLAGSSYMKKISWQSVNIDKIIHTNLDYKKFENNHSAAYMSVLEELYNKKLKFTKIIMNPPYDGNFHLKLVSTAMRLSDDIINLSPIRWLQDPLAEYKSGSDWSKFNNIRTHIESLNEIKAEDAQDMFESGQYENLGVYHITKKGGLRLSPKPFISQVLFDKVNLPTYQGKYKSLYDVRSPEGEPDYTKPFIKMSFAHGHVGSSDWYDIISRKLGVCTNKSVTGGKKLTASFTFNFDTQEEVENFFNYCNTDFVKACNGNVKTNIRWPGYAIPFMPTYSHPWTDEMLFEYFGIKQNEAKEIKDELYKNIS